MSTNPQWSYVQARLQARHGERLDDGDWRALEAARTVSQFLERSCATPLRHFTDHVNAQMLSHAMEGMLRAAWRDYVAEIADWVAPAWQPAVQWIAYLPDLPMIDAVMKGKAPAWVQSDPLFSALATVEPQQRARRAGNHLMSLFPANGNNETLAQRWLAHWRSLWPQRRGNDSEALDKLTHALKDHTRRLARASAGDTSGPYRRDLARAVTRIFRRGGGTPVAVFCHLALVALDLERLRGGLVRRRLFETGALAVMP